MATININFIPFAMQMLLVIMRFPLGSGTTDPPGDAFLRHTISPLAICDDNRPIDPHKKIEECHAFCNSGPTSKGKAKVTIYQDNSGSQKHKAVACEKWKVSQTFTQSWTFSTIKSQVVKEKIKPDLSDCIDLVGERCPNYQCEYHIPPDLKEEYYYASTHTVTSEYVTLITLPAVLMFIDGDYHIKIAQEPETFRPKDSPIYTDKVVYLLPDKEATDCPFAPGLTTGCDKWQTGESMNYICSGGRLAFESSGSKTIDAHCPIGTRISPEGIIYKEEKGEPATGYDAQRISMVADNKLAGDSETLRILTANSLVHLDADMCSMSCEMAGLELRVSRRQTTLIRTGPGFIMLSPKGHGYDCAKAVQCNIVKPYKFCGSPPRIHIACDGKFYFWDPLQSYVLLDNSCHAPSSAEKLYIHLGSKKYLLDDDISFEVLANETDTVRTLSYAIAKGSIIKYEDLPDLRSGWSQSKNAQRSSIEVSTNKTIEQHSIFSNDFFQPFKSAARWLGQAVSNVERGMIALFLVVGCIYISRPILDYLLKKKSKRQSPRSYVSKPLNQQEYEVEMI